MLFQESQAIIKTAIGGGLCPLGYAAGIDDLVVSLMETMPTAVLLDVRLKARSRWYPSWNKSALQAKWGPRYVHEKRLGNVNYQYPDCPIQLLGPEAVLPWILAQLQQDVVFLLVCACRDYECCHRKTVAEYILRRCQDCRRSSGMRFDLVRSCYIGVLPSGAQQMVVSPEIFEFRRSLFDPALLYEPRVWANDEVPGMATLEPVF